MTDHLRGSAIIFGIVLTACSSSFNTDGSSIVDAPTQRAAGRGTLYVADAHAVTAYDLVNGTFLRSILNTGPTAMAINGRGNLFVANFQANAVSVYAPGATSPWRVITQGLDGPRALAFDRSGDLYVANNLGKSVTVYAPGSGTVLRTITDRVNGPEALVFSKAGYLFVGNNGSSQITVYRPSGELIRTIITHNGPLALAFGRTGYLFSVNNFNVTVYKPGGTTPYRTITDGISLPSTLAFDNGGNLYVANWGANMFRSTVSIYAPGQSIPSREIRKGIGYPLSMVFDSTGDLYVANSGPSTVTEYAPGSSDVERTIRSHVSTPTDLAIGQ